MVCQQVSSEHQRCVVKYDTNGGLMYHSTTGFMMHASEMCSEVRGGVKCADASHLL